MGNLYMSKIILVITTFHNNPLIAKWAKLEQNLLYAISKLTVYNVDVAKRGIFPEGVWQMHTAVGGWKNNIQSCIVPAAIHYISQPHNPSEAEGEYWLCNASEKEEYWDKSYS